MPKRDFADPTTLAAPADTGTDSLSQQDILEDFRLVCLSRELSLIARREVLTGKAKFGIMGDGKEVAQVALARAFQRGDYRAGYYRDQTFLLALGLFTPREYFAQLYADPYHDPFTGGRQMNCHFATPMIDENGQWLDLRDRYNVSADISSTGGQMARALGLALASKKFQENPALAADRFSQGGNEVVFCTIGDASTSEGVFWETVNAACVQQVPLAVIVWDDGYGISVPIKYQTTKSSISEALAGFQSDGPGMGMQMYRERGWDYPTLVNLFQQGIEQVRATHQPALFHINELTQPQGHSTSGSHERYKSAERLQWEREHDALECMADWLLREQIATEEEIQQIRQDVKREARKARDLAWRAANEPAQNRLRELKELYKQLDTEEPAVKELFASLTVQAQPLLSEIQQNARRLLYHLQRDRHPLREKVAALVEEQQKVAADHYRRHLLAEGKGSALSVPVIQPVFSANSPLKNGYEILNTFFDHALKTYPQLFAFGEDVGQIGGVNQGFAGLQRKYGEARVFDTGIREWTIMGQAIGMAMRGLRPIGEIQYLDYLIYGLEPLADDLATLRWRSDGKQKAPVIVRTRGHRLEGVWHAGSPLGMILNAIRGIHLCVPRDMVRAAGMYNTLLQADDPGLVIECLNGYRLKERLPDNMGKYTVPLGIPERLREGRDLTLVTYGSCVRIAQEACKLLDGYGISVELIDVQTLLPFDREHRIVDSLRKTNRILFLDEDVPGGATAYMLREVLEVQNGYRYLDAPPVTLTANAHRTPYGSDGDYFTKPNVEDVFEAVRKCVAG